MNEINCEEIMNRYRQLVEAIGGDINKVTHEEVLHIAALLNRVKEGLLHSHPEQTGSYFICGASDELDMDGLPSRIMICPAYGLNGFAVYKKERHWQNADIS